MDFEREMGIYILLDAMKLFRYHKAAEMQTRNFNLSYQTESVSRVYVDDDDDIAVVMFFTQSCDRLTRADLCKNGLSADTVLCDAAAVQRRLLPPPSGRLNKHL
jgi:hypothetical protein